jgi:GT2 family glycosyltransferase
MTRKVDHVSLIIPVGGAGATVDANLARCLASLGRLDPQPGEILVVLDGDDDRRAAGVAAAEIDARVVRLAESRGPAVARNAGARAASGELLFFIDADVEPAPDSIARVTEVFERRPELAALIGSYDDSPADPALLSQYRNLLHHFVHQQAQREASTFWGACGAIRKQVFDQVGGFDESFAEPSIEDIELGSRLKASGHRIALEPDLQVKHLKRWTVGNMLATDLWRRAVPWTELMLGDGGLIQDLNVKTSERFSVVVAFLMLGSLLSAWLFRPLAVVGVAAWLTLIFTNRSLYRFFLRRRGLVFAVAAMFWHWVYFLVCGLGFVLGWIRHLVGVGLASGRKPDA